MPRARRRRETPRSWPGAVLGAGPRLVLFHGGPGLDHRTLLPLAEQLTDSFEVWVPDLPGHGAAAAGNPGLATLQRFMARFVGLDGGADVVVAHSLGAFLLRGCIEAGAIDPRVGVVLFGAPSGGQPRVRGRRQRQRQRGDIADDLLAQVREETGRAASARFEACLRGASLRGPSTYPNLYKAASNALARPLVRLRPPFPVAVLHGANDGVVSEHQASEVAQATDAVLTVLPGVGHYPAATGADGVAAAIERFTFDPSGLLVI